MSPNKWFFYGLLAVACLYVAPFKTITCVAIWYVIKWVRSR